MPAKKKAKSGSKNISKSKVEDDVESHDDPAASEVEAPLESTSKAKKASAGRKKKPVIEKGGEEVNSNGQANSETHSRKKGAPRKTKPQARGDDEEIDIEKNGNSESEVVEKPVKARRGRKPKNPN